MKKLLITILLAQLMPLSLLAQDDDVYFVPKEKKETKEVKKKRTYDDGQNVYYCGSSRDVDEYNRRPYRGNGVVPTDNAGGVNSLSSANDSITIDSLVARKGRQIEAGTYDYDDEGEYKYTRRMRRYDGYDCHGMDYSDYCESYNSGYNNGYMDGMMSWNVSFGWYDPWWYSGRFYGWNGWYNAYYFGGWYNPWYYGWGWYDPWWHGGIYYPTYRPVYYAGRTGTRNHSRGSYASGSRRHGTYNGRYNGGRYNRNRYDYNDNNRPRHRQNPLWNNNSRQSENRFRDVNRGNSFNNRRGIESIRSHSGGLGGGTRMRGGGRVGRR